MANSCEFRTTEASTKSWLRTRNIIDKYLNILDLPKFRTTVNDLSNQAREKYGVEGRLFSEANDGKKAVPNKAAFKAIDNAKGIYYQADVEQQSVANDQTLAKVKKAIESMGVSLMTLSDYSKLTNINTTNVNGLADLTKNIIAIAEGREHEALTEEMVHVAFGILEQVDPRLVTEMISKIGRFKVYQMTLDQYKDDPRYQLENGKPNIRKIKIEAVGKLIAETIINGESEEYPDLANPENLSMLERFWNAILDLFRGMYKKSDISIFEKAGDRILEGLGPANLTGEGIYLQKTIQSVDDIYNTLRDMNNKLKLVPATETDTRHYTDDGVRVAQTVTEKVKGSKEWKDVSEFQKKIYDQKKEWGIDGHRFAEKYLTASLLDENGYARKTPLVSDIDTKIPTHLQKSIKSYLEDLVNSYKPGTRFLVETKVVNKKVKGLLASTVDLLVIEPDDALGFRMDIYDWKFTDLADSEDVQWYKSDEWKQQMGEYAKMMYNIDVKPKQIRRARMIPFVVKYKPEVRGDWSTPLKLSSLEVGAFDNLKEKKVYLLPVALDIESTGNKRIDELVSSLSRQYEKMWKQPAPTLQEKYKKGLELNQLSKSIRMLKMSLNFEPIVSVMYTFLKNADGVRNSFENIDIDNLSKEETEQKLRELIKFKDGAVKFLGIQNIYKTMIDNRGEEMTDEEIKLFKSLEARVGAIERMLEVFTEIQKNYVVSLANKYGISKESILSPEKPITSFVEKNLLEGTKLSSQIIQLGQRMILESKSLAKVKANALIDQFFEKLRALETEASAAGKTPFEMIGEVNNGNLNFVKKIDKKFYEEKDKAANNKDKQFFLDNMDVEAYNKEVQKIIEDTNKEIENAQFSSDPEINELEKKYQISKIEKLYNIESVNFDGYNRYEFQNLFKKYLKEDKFLSKEYKDMVKSPAALEMWKFFVNLNERARDMGYLSNKGNSFFPLIEAAFIQKINQTGDPIGQAKDFFKDLYTINPNEEQLYAKWDEETGKVKKSIPKLFTRTNKEVDQLSKDLNKVGTLWIQSLMEYEETKNLEATLLTMLSFEKSKGQIAVANGKIVYKEGQPLIEDKSVNADIFEIIIDDSVYGIREDESSLGNVALDAVTEKFVSDEKKKNAKVVSVKKAFKNGNILTQSLAVGLKTLIAIPNYAGVNFQSFINSGSRYTFYEYMYNQGKVVGDTFGFSLSTIEKGVIDKFIPLNEGIANEKQRERAIREGKYAQWISNWSFNDVMMSTNAFPERKLQITNALSYLENTMLVDGKLVNIREYVTAQDRNRYKLSYEERKEIERTKEERIKKLKEEKSLMKVAKEENGNIVIEGLTDEEIAKYRVKISEYGRDLSGSMSNDNKAGYRRDTMLSSFMMFKGWIPKQVSQRTLDIEKDIVSGDWRYGRSRLLAKVIVDLGIKNIGLINDILQGTDKGLTYMNELLDAKREAYEKKYGKPLEITEEEFYDLVRKELTNQFKELGLLFGLLAVLLTSKIAAPDDDDEDAYTRNRYKYFAKLTNKIVDEVSFYYNPLSIQAITSGNIVPQIGLLAKATKALYAIEEETRGTLIGNQELIDKSYPLKYTLDIVPIGSQFQREVLPIIYPELAKEMGIRVTEQARLMR